MADFPEKMRRYLTRDGGMDMADANQYLHSAEFYDFGNARADVGADVDFYFTLIPATASVLEVGCGTGRVALPLARRGNPVVGIDLSAPMLDVFSAKLLQDPAAARNLTLQRWDMRDFDLGRVFDWILFPFRVFQGLRTDAERRHCLRSVLRHMSGESRLVLTLFNPRQDLLRAWGVKGILDFEIQDKDTGRTVKRFQDQLWHDAEKQVIAVEQRYEVREKGVLFWSVTDFLELGYLYPEQCLNLFASMGLDVVDAFGGYDRRPLIPEERKELIYVLRKDDAVSS